MDDHGNRLLPQNRHKAGKQWLGILVQYLHVDSGLAHCGNGDVFKERRALPPDYPHQAHEQIKKAFGWTDAGFEAEMKKLRQPYDDPRRTPSKRALLETIRQACEAAGTPIWPGDREWQVETECAVREAAGPARLMVRGGFTLWPYALDYSIAPKARRIC